MRSPIQLRPVTTMNIIEHPWSLTDLLKIGIEAVIKFLDHVILWESGKQDLLRPWFLCVFFCFFVQTSLNVWLVLWNMLNIFHFIWGNPFHWRTHIFQDGYCTTNQMYFVCLYRLKTMKPTNLVPHGSVPSQGTCRHGHVSYLTSCCKGVKR